MNADLELQLAEIERLARGGKLARLLRDPLRYLQAIGYWRLVYPLKKQGRLARARTFFGAEMDVVLPSATEIFLFGAKTHDSEIRLTRFLMKNLRPGGVFADVGAHFGYFTLLAAHLVGGAGRVFAFEAGRSTFEVLKKNTAAAPNVEALHRAASDTDKTLVFNEFPVLFSEFNSLVLPERESAAAWLRRNPPQRVEVAGQRLDAFFSEKKAVPDVVKIDVEGAEPQVLRGMEAFLKNHSPVLVMEYLAGGGQAHQEAVAFAQSLGFQVFLIKNDGGLEPCEDLEKAFSAKKTSSDNIVLRKT